MKKPFVIGLILLLSLTGCKSINNPPVQYKPDDELVVLAHGLGRSDGQCVTLPSSLNMLVIKYVV
ncbi:hypothetical protein [Pseudoalteromonas sp. S3785]|uniref:hypothetical protein n=1 Tax=Pseudoalteromonas sp. S3785 TaxID=579545 RepID=UPI00201DD8CD|nr:hypothetical protein [Pseudoalteromonas sp. S3785]